VSSFFLYINNSNICIKIKLVQKWRSKGSDSYQYNLYKLNNNLYLRSDDERMLTITAYMDKSDRPEYDFSTVNLFQ
jgi:hypothetical protein